MIEVAERVAGEPLAVREPVLEERGASRVVRVGQRDEAVADVARRQHAELARGAGPEEPPSSAIVTTAVVSKPRSSRQREDEGRPVPPPIATARDPSDAHRCSRSRPMSRWLDGDR